MVFPRPGNASMATAPLALSPSWTLCRGCPTARHATRPTAGLDRADVGVPVATSAVVVRSGVVAERAELPGRRVFRDMHGPGFRRTGASPPSSTTLSCPAVGRSPSTSQPRRNVPSSWLRLFLPGITHPPVRRRRSRPRRTRRHRPIRRRRVTQLFGHGVVGLTGPARCPIPPTVTVLGGGSGRLRRTSAPTTRFTVGSSLGRRATAALRAGLGAGLTDGRDLVVGVLCRDDPCQRGQIRHPLLAGRLVGDRGGLAGQP